MAPTDFEDVTLCELRAQLCDCEMISRMLSAKEPNSSCAPVDSERGFLVAVASSDGGGSSEAVGAAASWSSLLIRLLAGPGAAADSVP